MLSFIEILKAVLFGIVEGVTEWLPVSSTGHMILLNEFVHMNVSEDFWDMFLVVIQLGAILAVVLLFWKQLWPFRFAKKGVIKTETMNMWFKIIVACVPAAVVGLLFDDFLEKYLYTPTVVAIMLILFGIGFIIIENGNKSKTARVRSLSQLSYKDAIIIGMFQLIAAVFPGTSRSGATILGGLMIGVSRTVAAEFTFFLAIPVMLGASLLKIGKFFLKGYALAAGEAVILLVAMAVAFIVSVLVIRFLMGYIKKHDFKVFGWYRIALGAVVLLYFYVIK